MIGLWLEARQLSLRRDLALPRPAPGEALVRVLQAGICNTDLELVSGYYPYRGVPGHEFVGRVEAGAPALLGERVGWGRSTPSAGAAANAWPAAFARAGEPGALKVLLEMAGD